MNTTTIPLAATDDQPQTDGPGIGMLTCGRGWLPLTEVNIETGISGLDATVTIRQSFANPFSDAIEATYIHPLPDRAAVTAFSMTIGERRIEGRTKRGRNRPEPPQTATTAAAFGSGTDRGRLGRLGVVRC